MWFKILAFLTILLAAYIVGIEPIWMKWTEQEVRLAKLRHPIEILLLSDTQLRGKTGFREEWILKQIRTRQFDLILTAGDLFDTPAGMRPAVEFLEALSKFGPTFAILGNWENWSWVNLNEYKQILSQKGITLLVNENRELNWHGQKIYLLGVDDPSQDLHILPLALKNVPDNSLKILMAHAPIIFDLADPNHIDLVIAGHSHGGQVKLPFMDPLFLPPGCGPYFYGLYEKK